MKAAEYARLRVEVVYLRPGLTFRRSLLLEAPATVGKAIEASEIRLQVPELAGTDVEAGVFGQRREPTCALHDGDRVEIYRPLTIEPKEARRVRAAVRRRRRAGEAGKAG